MSKALKCDWCGKYFEPESLHWTGYTTVDSLSKEISDRWRDLCEDCFDALEMLQEARREGKEFVFLEKETVKEAKDDG